jgi:hypothetical protein
MVDAENSIEEFGIALQKARQTWVVSMDQKNAAVSTIVRTKESEVPGEMVENHATRQRFGDRSKFFTDGGNGIVALDSEAMQAASGAGRFLGINDEIALHADFGVVRMMQPQD